MLQVTKLTKDFPGGRVLENVSFLLASGEILGIIGENGAGKSTLAKIIAGLLPATSGSVEFTTNESVLMIPQEFNLVPELSVRENIFLGREMTRFGLLNAKAMRQRTRTALETLECSLNPDALVRDLSVPQRQMVELSKALVHECNILILDEPTTVLSDHETECLFAQVRRFTSQGGAAILVSHRLRDVRSLCSRVLVLRDGQPVCLEPTANLSEEDMARRMVGRELSDIYPPKLPARRTQRPVMDIFNLTAKHGYPNDVSLSLHRGEILGFAGLNGSGRTEFAEALIGIRPLKSGKARISQMRGAPADLYVPSSPSHALRYGLSYLPEDRQNAGVLLPFDIPFNITLSSLKRYAHPFLDRRKLRATAEKYVQEFGIKARGGSQTVERLSGGNQQKVSLAKCLDTLPLILIVDEPTRGVDINAKRDIYSLLFGLTQQGVSIILISSEMEEILGLSHRVIVMREGRVAATLYADALTEENIILYATGVAKPQTLKYDERGNLREQ